MSHALAVALALAVLCCDICVTIRVPVVWDDDSEVTQTKFSDQEPQTSADKVQPQKPQETVPIEYFQYTAKKPQFAVDIAKFHGVQSPEEHYKAYPVTPYTGKQIPELGRHRIQDPTRPVFQKFQQYLKNDEEFTPKIKPVSQNYEVFHPYKAEEPGFKELYKDPILDKIRNDIRDSSQRLQTYENEAGKPNIESGEYLESADETDRKKIPQRNIPAPYEIHRPQRRPVYYRPAPRYSDRDEILNKRFRHPWNQNFVKIRPAHYVPLQNHLHRLRQHHALKYNDDRNEYPQVPVQQHYEEPSEGYDIYEKGKAKYVQLRNNLDESVNNVAKESRPSAPQKLELQASEESEPDEEDEFVPVKNYAQVRKTETTKHLPKSAAFDDADSYEEIRNAPRLREAIKSSKAQTVYTEEGYEDSAYDHAGEQKHASDHEAHAGYLKENELSGGKYKAPSFSGAYDDGNGSTFKNQKLHSEKWKDDLKENQKEKDSEEYTEDEHERYIEADSYEQGPAKRENSQRNKRQEDSASIGESKNIEDPENVDDDFEGVEDSENVDESENGDEQNNTSTQHDVNKRETKEFKVPVINLDAIFTNDKDVIEIVKQKIEKDDIKEKYPYYFKNLKAVNEHSPLRYAENLKFIPKKSDGGTEFYDSRSQLECPEVDENVDAIPDKLKKNGHPDADEETQEENLGEKDKKKAEVPNGPRLSGLGDKIDCFKAKYFGRNPLDSPFFKEEIISNPEPPTLPDLTSFKLKKPTGKMLLDSAPSNIILSAEKLRNDSQRDIFELLQKLNSSQNKLTDSVVKGTDELKTVFIPQNHNFSNSSLYTQQNNIFNDILEKNRANSNLTLPSTGGIFTTIKEPQFLNNNSIIRNLTHDYSQNNKDITKSATSHTRKKRASSFVYEPYKIIRDVQVADTKKTTTTSNISPLIKQLQSSKVIDTVVKDQPVKRTANSRTYKDIGRKDRAKNAPIEMNDNTERSFIDVNSDKRRGEPRYELKPSNHKSQYSPVNNNKSMSREDYEAQTKYKENAKKDGNQSSELKPRRPAPRALYDISRFIPKSEEIQKSAASNTVKTTVASSTPTRQTETLPSAEGSDESEEDYDDEYEDEEEVQETSTSTTTTTTTTTTPKPIFRRRMRSTTTTEKEETVTTESPKLRLVTRFRTPPPPEKSKTTTESPQKKYGESEERPKYREKKKKSSKSTLVTDTKKYGDDNDDMRKEEIDALIGVKHDMDEYIPMYEKEAERKRQNQEAGDSEEEEVSSEEDEDEDEDDDDDDDDDDDNEEEDDDEEEDDETTATKVSITTTEGPKRTLSKTTDTPPSTTETRKNEKLEVKPVIVKKKIEIHKELPVNQSSPHITQYKQDIEEEEIIKEIPRKIPEKKQHKDIELLDFYKDENLAKDINQLGGVEVFKENLDLKNGPKHGGNYKRAPDVTEEPETTTAKGIRRRTKPPKDAVASQTENKKHIELSDDDIPARGLHGGNLKSISDLKYSRGNRKNEKLIELTTENYSRAMHGGNLKSIKDRGAKRFSDKSAKLIELDSSNDDDEEDDSKMHGGNFKSSGSRSSERGSRLHGGNYRSAKLIAADNEKGETQALANSSKGLTPRNARANAAVLLNSFAQAAPIILTTTPAYILDPSKRMYYYVDA